MPLSAVKGIAAIGERFPLPETRFFFRGLILSVVLFAIIYGVAILLRGSGSDFFLVPTLGRTLIRGLLVLCGLLFAGSGMGLLYRGVFFKGGGAIVRLNADNGIATGSYVAAMARRNFSDGCVIVFCSMLLLVVVFVFIPRL